MKKLLLTIVVIALAYAAHGADRANDITADNVIVLMNRYRAAEGLAPLHADERLMLAAEDRMRNMEEESYWSHESPEGMPPFVWLRARAYDYRAAGENLAAGFETARLLVESWMESPGHRANILSADFEDCGVAIIDGSTKGPATGRSVVVLFAKKKATMTVSRGAR